jgi:ribose transport system permease protein
VAIAAHLRFLNQERIVLAAAVALFVIFSIVLNGFASPDNLFSLVQAVTIIGVLGVAMAMLVIGRGIDLSMIAVLCMPVAWMIVQTQNGVPIGIAFLWALAASLIVGLLNGWLIAYAEVPAIFATIATGIVTYGTFQFFFVPMDIAPFPPQIQWLSHFWLGRFLGIPNTVIFFAAVLCLGWLSFRYTKIGRFIFAMGDNPIAARITGIPVRPVIMLQYLMASVIALLAGIVLASTVASANTRLFNSTMIYDVVLVVVLGGIGLSGGKGSIRNVIVGTALIGIIVNGMTIMDLSSNAQNLIRASILLLAIVVDSLINPRDEQTSQQGDI